MKTLEKLLEQYNNEIKEGGYYNDTQCFLMWLGRNGYRINGVEPIYIKSNTHRANDWINSNNLILTNVRFELDVIQMLQDKGMTFREMNYLAIRMLDKLLNETK